MKKSAIWLVIILLMAAFFRLWDLKNVPPGLWSDEAMNGINTIQALENGGWKVFYPENFGREGLFINIQALFVKALGHEPWVLRLPSAIFGILTVLGLYLMTWELVYLGLGNLSDKVPLFSAFFMATSFWHINFSRIGFRAIMAPFFLVWGFYLLLLAIRKMRKPEILQDIAQRDGREHSNPPARLAEAPAKRAGGYARLEKFSGEALFALAGFIFGLGIHSYIAYRVAPFIALYLLWIFYKQYRAGKLKKGVCAPCFIILFIFMALVAASPLLIYFGQHPADFFGRTAGISIFNSPNPLAQFSENTAKTLQMFNFYGDFNWRHNYRGASQLWWPVGILFLLGIWKSLRKIIRNNSSHRESNFLDSPPLTLRGGEEKINSPSLRVREGDKGGELFSLRFILLWFFVMMLPVAISGEGLPHALRAIVLLPPAMIFAGLGLEALIEKTKPFQITRIEKELKILFFVFLIAVAANAFNQYFMRWGPNQYVYESFLGDETKIAHWLNSAPQTIKKYVVTDSVDTVDMTGHPLSFMPIVFITDTYFDAKQKEKNIYYLGKNEFDKIDCSVPCAIIPVESKSTIYATIRQKVPNLKISSNGGFISLSK